METRLNNPNVKPHTLMYKMQYMQRVSYTMDLRMSNMNISMMKKESKMNISMMKEIGRASCRERV